VGPGEVNTPGASTVEADLEAHSEQSEEAPEIDAQGKGSLDNHSLDKENCTPKSMNREGSCRLDIVPRPHR